jgi:phosphate-selective porin OprO/OprP
MGARNQRSWTLLVVIVLAAPPGEGFAFESHEATPPTETAQKASSEKDEQEGSKEQDGEKSQDQESKRRGFYWDRGLHLAGLWGDLKMKFGGEAQYDIAGYANQQTVEEIVGEFDGGGEWRRARLYTHGTFHKHFEFKFQYDFATTSPPQLVDASFAFNKLPLVPLKLLVGRFQAPLGLDGFTSSANLTFLERSTMTTAFLPSRNTGVLIWDNAPKHRIRYGIAIIEPADEFGVGDTENLGWSGRFTSALGRRGGRLLVHSGVNFYRRNVADTLSLKSRPESHLAPPFVNTGDFAAENVHTAVLEGALQSGPTSIQGELAYTRVGSSEEGNPKFWAFYVMGTHFLTGESRPYSESHGVFGRPTPKREVRDGSGGLGAFEIAFRFSHLDLTDKNIQGGILDDVSGAFNWYLTYYSRVMSNVIWSKREGAEAVWIFQVRLQLDI